MVGKRYVVFERGKIPGQRQRVYACRLRAVTNETGYDPIVGGWVPGKIKTPDTMQRSERNPARFVHEDTLKAQEAQRGN